ncbi:MAG: winged helix-turn-helix transcriptional regulator [bacterium]
MPGQSKGNLSEKKLEGVGYIAKNSNNTQRDISSSIGYSLGLTRSILKRLIKTEHIRTCQLHKTKVEYLLTPKGFLEKTKKSYENFIKPIDSVKEMHTLRK